MQEYFLVLFSKLMQEIILINIFTAHGEINTLLPLQNITAGVLFSNYTQFTHFTLWHESMCIAWFQVLLEWESPPPSLLELPHIMFRSFLFSEMCAVCLNGNESSCLLFVCIVWYLSRAAAMCGGGCLQQKAAFLPLRQGTKTHYQTLKPNLGIL